MRLARMQPNARRRLIGAVSCYAILLALAAGGAGIAIVVLGVAIGAFVADWRLGLGEEERQLEAPGRLALALAALVLWPIAANLLIISIVLAGGHPLDDLPPAAGVGVIGLAATAAGVTAAQHRAPSTSHGWWALAGGASGITLFGVFVVVASS
jgi:hypothetical protein